MIRKFSTKNPAKPKILILGGGFAGSNVLREIQRKFKGNDVEITLISQDNFFLFTPMLPEISSGMLHQAIFQRQSEHSVRQRLFVMPKFFQLILWKKR